MTIATLTLADGSKRTLPLIPNGNALEIRDRNGGLPDAWGMNQWRTGAPVLWDSLDVDLPDTHAPLGPELRGFVQTGPSSWSLARASQYKYHAKRNGVDIYGSGVGQHHATLPGDTLYFRFEPKTDPFGIKEIQAGDTAGALAVFDFDTRRIATWPWLQKVIASYTMDASSFDVNTPAGHRNVGFLLNPYGFCHRWNTPQDLPKLLHWYGSPGSREAGVGLRNEHYHAAAAWIGSGLLRGDDASVSVGLDLLRQQIAYGLIWCDANCRHRGLFRTEAGDDCRGTQTLVPGWAKGLFNRGLIAAEKLTRGRDAFIHDAFILHGDYLLTCPHEWNGAGGARNIGRFLESLWHFWKATGDSNFAARATVEIANALTIIGAASYFPENRGSTSVSCGEGLLALAYARRWVIDGGIMPTARAKLDEMLDWTLTHCWNPATGRWGYFCDSASGIITYSGDFQFCMGPVALDLPPDVRAKSEAYAYLHYANNPQCDAAFGGEGPGWPKWWHSIATTGAWR